MPQRKRGLAGAEPFRRHGNFPRSGF